MTPCGSYHHLPEDDNHHRHRRGNLKSYKNYHFSMSSRPALGSTRPPIQWVPGALSPGVKLTTHLQLVPRSRIRGSIHPLPHTSSCRSAELVKHRDNCTLFYLWGRRNRSLRAKFFAINSEGANLWNRLRTYVVFSKGSFYRIKYKWRYCEGSWSVRRWLVLRGATGHLLQVIFRNVSVHNVFQSSKVGTSRVFATLSSEYYTAAQDKESHVLCSGWYPRRY
jgi:hypothetical protein